MKWLAPAMFSLGCLVTFAWASIHFHFPLVPSTFGGLAFGAYVGRICLKWYD